MFFQDLLKQHTAVLHTSDNRAVVCFPLVWTLPLLLQGASILPPFSQGERERESLTDSCNLLPFTLTVRLKQ